MKFNPSSLHVASSDAIIVAKKCWRVAIYKEVAEFPLAEFESNPAKTRPCSAKTGQAKPCKCDADFQNSLRVSGALFCRMSCCLRLVCSPAIWSAAWAASRPFSTIKNCQALSCGLGELPRCVPSSRQDEVREFRAFYGAGHFQCSKKSGHQGQCHALRIFYMRQFCRELVDQNLQMMRIGLACFKRLPGYFRQKRH